MLELGPFLGVMAEPAAQFGAGRDRLEPQVDMGLVLAQPPRPQAIDQNARSVRFRRRLIDPLQRRLHRLSPEKAGSPPAAVRSGGAIRAEPGGPAPREGAASAR